MSVLSIFFSPGLPLLASTALVQAGEEQRHLKLETAILFGIGLHESTADALNIKPVDPLSIGQLNLVNELGYTRRRHGGGNIQLLKARRLAEVRRSFDEPCVATITKQTQRTLAPSTLGSFA